MLSVLQYSVTLLLYFTISYPCILLFQSEFCLSLQDCGQFQPFEIVSNSRTKRNETRKLRVFSFPLPSRFSFLDLKIKNHRTNNFIRLESFLLIIIINFLLSKISNSLINTRSREIEGKREQTIINNIPYYYYPYCTGISDRIPFNLPLPSLHLVSTLERYIVMRAPTRILTFSPISVTKGAPRCLPLVSDSASGRAIAREFEIQINTERVHR